MMNLQIQRMLQQATGLSLSSDVIDTAIRKRMNHRQIQDLPAYAMEVVNGNDELDALIDLVVVPETWFFRDAAAFPAAARYVAAMLAAGRRTIRILSIPCASGEEPYSLAMTLRDADIAPEHFVIDAVDISPRAICRAQRGVYQRNAFRSSCNSPDLYKRYFDQNDEGFKLVDDVRKPVQFRRGNLLTLEPLDGTPYDIVFCRNLLIYFDEATQNVAISKLHSLLDDEGLLFCGYAEATMFCLRDFTRAPYSHVFALRKKNTVPNPPALPILQAARCMRPQAIPSAAHAPLRPATLPRSMSGEPSPSQENSDALLEHANRLADQGAFEEASQAYRAYLDRVPDSAQAHFMLGLLSEQRAEDERAEEFLRRAIYLDPNHYEALCHLALLTERRGNSAGARSFRRRAARVFGRRAGGQAR